MADYTIKESYTLPSKGQVYPTQIKADFTIRSMTTQDEMLRASSDNSFKPICDLIDNCLIDKPSISSYDMCMGDYTYLLHRLRVITYGQEYKMLVRCPVCGNIEDVVLNLDELKVNEYNEEEFKNYSHVHLPQSGKEIELNFMTPRMQDTITKRVNEIIKNSKDKSKDPTLIQTLVSWIKTIDGVTADNVSKEKFVRDLPMKDTNIIIKTAEKLNNVVGVSPAFKHTCKNCEYEVLNAFAVNSEFFSPSL